MRNEIEQLEFDLARVTEEMDVTAKVLRLTAENAARIASRVYDLEQIIRDICASNDKVWDNISDQVYEDMPGFVKRPLSDLCDAIYNAKKLLEEK